MDIRLLKEIIQEEIKRKIPDCLEKKLLSLEKNQMQWLYYGKLIWQEKNELRLLVLKVAQEGCSLHGMLSQGKHQSSLNEYKEQQFKYFRLMCCDALDICNELSRDHIQLPFSEMEKHCYNE